MVQQDDPNDRFANRIVELELTLTHLQRDVEGLNETILFQNSRIEELLQKIEQLDARVDSVSPTDEQRDPNQERPPHY